MLTIFRGPTPNGFDAGDIHAAIVAAGIEPVWNVLIQERQNGAVTILDRVESVAEMFRRFAVQLRISEGLSAQLFAGEAPTKRVIIGEVAHPAQVVEISSNVRLANGDVPKLADFPVGWSFGSGVTANATVRLSDNQPHLLSWVGFLDSDAPIVRLRFPDLRMIVEGV